MSHVWAGDMDIRMAKDMGRLQLKGDSNLMRTISSWLRPGTFAHIRPESGPVSIKQSRGRVVKTAVQQTKKQLFDKGAELYAKT
jgi:hypothetical protein